jgi:predicted DNA binding CopG/RHH family protein|tara:strand:- start:215 stop:565 length:351 start_codon:yes stop_codon:yes gene_type:complete
MVRLDPEEQELLESLERDEWRPVAERETEVERYRRYARTTFKKDMRVNIRISRKDLEAIQKRALEEGIPYQTLMASVLHKYVSGRLVELDALSLHPPMAVGRGAQRRAWQSCIVPP